MTTGRSEPAAKSPYARKARLRRMMAKVARWLHIYLSMASFAVVLFFALTGLTLNHPGWFANQQRTVERHGVLPGSVVEAAANASDEGKLRVSENLRFREHLSGALSDFRVDDQQIAVSYKGPGYTADIFINRATGRYDLTEVRSGLVAVMNDLHKGRDAGRVWAWFIDVSAVLLVLVSLTGLLLIFFLYKRRTSGLVLAGVAAVLCVMLWKLFVA